jgi:hypothetical protein
MLLGLKGLMSLGQPSAFCLRAPLIGTVTLSYLLSALRADPATKIVCNAGQGNCNVSDEILDPWSTSERKIPAGPGHLQTISSPLVGFHRVSSLSMKHGGRLCCAIQARYDVSHGILRPLARSRLAATGPGLPPQTLPAGLRLSNSDDNARFSSRATERRARNVAAPSAILTTIMSRLARL